MIENYYNILGVEEDSDLESIKKAYRRLAMKCHPDKNRGDPLAEEKFEYITKAYDILTDEDKRQEYDKKLVKSPTSILQGSDNLIVIKVKIQEVINGILKMIVTKRKNHCPDCDGTGAASKKTKKCIYCNGTGLQGLDLVLGHKKKCRYCDGLKVAPVGEKCLRCHGEGLIFEIVKKEIKLSPLLSIIELPGLGNYPLGKGKPGNLIIHLDISKDSKYKISGLDIFTTIGVSPAQAVLGDSIPLSVFNKTVILKVPAGTRHGQVVMQERGGITCGGQTGNFKAVINVLVPEIITEEEKELYKRILDKEKLSSSWSKIDL